MTRGRQCEAKDVRVNQGEPFLREYANIGRPSRTSLHLLQPPVSLNTSPDITGESRLTRKKDYVVTFKEKYPKYLVVCLRKGNVKEINRTYFCKVLA